MVLTRRGSSLVHVWVAYEGYSDQTGVDALKKHFHHKRFYGTKRSGGVGAKAVVRMREVKLLNFTTEEEYLPHLIADLRSLGFNQDVVQRPEDVEGGQFKKRLLARIVFGFVKVFGGFFNLKPVNEVTQKSFFKEELRDKNQFLRMQGFVLGVSPDMKTKDGSEHV